MISIHNNPENLQLPAKYARLQFALADVDTQDISPFFAPSYDFIEEARAAGHGRQRCILIATRSRACVVSISHARLRDKLISSCLQQESLRRACASWASVSAGIWRITRGQHQRNVNSLRRPHQAGVASQRCWCTAARASAGARRWSSRT